MKYLKKFEAFAGAPLPVAPLNLFAMYYHCHNCDAVYATINRADKCLNCHSPHVETITEKEMVQNLKGKLSPEEFQEFLQMKKNGEDQFIYLDELEHEGDVYEDDKESPDSYGYSEQPS